MRHSFYLAWRYSYHYRLTTAVLVFAISLIGYLPLALEVIVDNAAKHFRSRAAETPIVLGAKGSPLDLLLANLYFDRASSSTLQMEQMERIEKQELARVIPLHARFRTRGSPVVGTTKEYFSLRRLRFEAGREEMMLGECVVGAAVATRLEVGVGSKIPMSSESAFSLQDAPLRLKVAGVLAPTETPDDEAIFVGLKTTWLVEGLGHGHAKNAEHGSAEAVEYTDVTEDNISSFHFHGKRSNYPITAIIALPHSEKHQTILLGQYFSDDETTQIVQPSEVMDTLLSKVLMVRSYILAIVVVVSAVTLFTMSLVISLSIRIRNREMVMMTKMGCSRFTIASILGSQVLLILGASALVATFLTFITDAYGREIVRWLIL